MLREEQIDLRRRRAAAEPLKIQNLGRNRVFSDYRVSNVASGGQYRVSIRGFDVGDNTCECPDFKTNTLGTCKHIEAVLAALRDEAPPTVRRRKAAVTQPQVLLRYGEQLRLALLLPPRPSDALQALADTFFDPLGLWKAGDHYQQLIEQISNIPEAVTIFSDAMEFMEREMERAEMALKEQEWLALLDKGELPDPLRDLLRVPLYPYQLRGALFAACRGRCILGDDMGLGKTVQTLAAAELLARERGIERVLVVAPSSVKYQWETEIHKFTGRPVQVVDGTTAQRRALYRQPTFYRLVNYELAVRDIDELNAWQPDLIVLDEAQRIKNWEARTTRAIKRLRSRYAFVLTGTPLENKLEELYSIVQFVDDRRLGPAFQFLAEHRVLDAEGQLKGYRHLAKIRDKIAPILLRRTRAEVLTQLPARTDTTVYVEMAEAQRGPYAEQQHNLAMLLQRKIVSDVDRRRILACLTSMRMVCDSTGLIDPTTPVSPKLDELAELLPDLLTPPANKVVIFSQWEKMLTRAVAVAERFRFGHVVLHGGIPGPQRRGLVERFRDDPACRIFFSTDAGGTGLNLQAAHTVINLEPPWNPAVLEQRVARVHRLGQHQPVQVIHFVTRDSIEERVLRVLQRKRTLFAGVFEGNTDEVAFASLGHQTFLDTVRELVEEAPAQAPPSSPVIPLPAIGTEFESVQEAGVRFLESLASALEQASGMVTRDSATGRPMLQIPVPPRELLERGTAALRTVLQTLAEKQGSPTADR